MSWTVGKGAGECLRVGRRSLGWPSPAPYLSSCLRQAKWERHQRESLRNSRWPQRLPLRSMTSRCEWWVPVCERNRLQSSRRALERHISLQAFLLWVHWPVRLPEIDKLQVSNGSCLQPCWAQGKGVWCSYSVCSQSRQRAPECVTEPYPPRAAQAFLRVPLLWLSKGNQSPSRERRLLLWELLVTDCTLFCCFQMAFSNYFWRI